MPHQCLEQIVGAGFFHSRIARNDYDGMLDADVLAVNPLDEPLHQGVHHFLIHLPLLSYLGYGLRYQAVFAGVS